MRVKDAFDRLIKDLPPNGISIERPKSTCLKILLALPCAEEVAAINALVDQAYERAQELYEEREQAYKQEKALHAQEFKQERQEYMMHCIRLLLLFFILYVLCAVLIKSFLVALILPFWILLIWFLSTDNKLPQFSKKERSNRAKPVKESYYQPPVSYTHLALELSPRGGVVYEYNNGRNVGFVLEFKWYEIKQVIQRLVLVPYVLLRVSRTSGYPLFSELRSAVKIEYCSQLLNALIQQRNIGSVPEDWYQPEGLEAYEPEDETDLPDEKMKIDREEHDLAPLVDLSMHLIDDNIY